MWLDLLAVAILGCFVALGAWRGALVTGLGLATLGGSYAAAIGLGPALGPPLCERLGISAFWGLPLAGSGVFLATYTALSLAGRVVRRLARRRGEERGARDRFLGGVFGAVRGIGIVLLVSYLALWIDALRATGASSPLPSVEHSKAAALTGEVVESGVEAALGHDATARVAARLAARPGVAVGELQGVLDTPQVGALRDDAVFWTYVESGAVDAALTRPSYLSLQRDTHLRQQFADLGLVPAEAAEDPHVFRSAMADVLRQAGPRLRGVKNDPAWQELRSDPEVLAMVQSGDTFGLLRHPGFRRLLARVTSAESD